MAIKALAVVVLNFWSASIVFKDSARKKKAFGVMNFKLCFLFPR